MTQTPEDGLPRWVKLSGLVVAIVVLLGLTVRLIGLDHGLGHPVPHGCHGAP